MRQKQNFKTPPPDASVHKERIPGILKRAKAASQRSAGGATVQKRADVATEYRETIPEGVPPIINSMISGTVRPLTEEERRSLFILVDDHQNARIAESPEIVQDNSDTLFVQVAKVGDSYKAVETEPADIPVEEWPPEEEAVGERFRGVDGKSFREPKVPKHLRKRLGPLRWFEDSPSDQFQCLLCGKSMEARALSIHLPKKHSFKVPDVAKAAFSKYIRKGKIPVASFTPPKYRDGTGACPDCRMVFNRRLDLLDHMLSEHQRTFALFDFEFECLEQFEQWLQTVLRDYKTGYTRNRTNTSPSGVKTQMYLCRMEAQPRKERNCKTDRRAQNRTRVSYCTAHLLVKYLEDGRLHVRGSPTHINHEVSQFNACRSLDDVPMDGLPGYTTVISSHVHGIPKTTYEFCQSILRKVDSLKSLVTRSPVPSDDTSLRLLHSKLVSLEFATSTYKFRELVVQEPNAQS